MRVFVRSMSQGSHTPKVRRVRETATEFRRAIMPLSIRAVEGRDGEYDLSFSSETTKVQRYDYYSGRIIPEILIHDEDSVDLSPLMEVGAILRNHDVNQIIGAPLSVKIDHETGRGLARMRFGTTTRAKEAHQEAFVDKTLRGVSCGYDYNPETAQRLKEGEIFRTKSGREFTGPAIIVPRWSVHELSLTPCPADSTVGLERSNNTKGNPMEMEFFIKSLCGARGLSSKSADEIIKRGLKTFAEAEAAVKAYVETPAEPAPAVRGGKKKKRKLAAVAARAEGGDDDDDEEDEDDEAERAAELANTRTLAINTERTRTAEINAIGTAAQLDNGTIQRHINEGTSVEAFRTVAFAHVTQNADGGFSGGSRGSSNVNVSEDGAEKRYRHYVVNLGRRAFQGAAQTFDDKKQREGFTFEDDTTKGVEHGHATICDAARAWLQMIGVRGVEYMDAPTVAMQYFNQRNHLRAASLNLRGNASANTSADMSNALSALQNKSLMMAFKQTKQTWRSWARVGSLADFKQAPAVQMSDMGQLKELRENEEINDSKLTDRAEVRQLEIYARKLGFDIRMFINDDISAFSRLPALMGKAARQLPSKLVYAHLMGNPTMSDSVALFHATHNNLLTGAGSVLAAAGLAAAIASFRRQTTYAAPNDPEAATENVEIEPAVLLVPPTLELTANQLANPNLFVTDNKFFQNKFEIEVEPRLENTGYTGYSAAYWYLAARASDADTMEVSFLNGNENPVTGVYEDFHALTQWFRVWLACGVKALDWRGINRSNGA